MPCLSAAPGAAHASAVHPSRGLLRLSDEGVSDPASIDPPSPEANDAQSNLVEGLVLGGLVRLDPNLHVRPDAAAAWKISNDGKTYTFTLRPGLKFADGTPLTAQDVVWSFNRAFSPAFAAGATENYLGDIVGGTDVAHKKATTVRGIKAIGTRTVQITLARPAPAIASNMVGSVSVGAGRSSAKRGASDDEAENARSSIIAATRAMSATVRACSPIVSRLGAR